MKHVFIVNPKSSYGRALLVSKAIEEVCQKNSIDYEIHYTERPKDATNIARSYKRDKCIIFSVGGDGTLNEVVNGVVGSKNYLGVIPAGTGNDLYKTLKQEKELYFDCDLGKINNDYFINTASVGLDAEIADNVIVMKRKKVPRKMIYNAAILYTFFKFQAQELEIIIDNKKVIKGKKLMVAVANGQVYGGGFKIAPDASLNDGLLDVVLVDNMSKPRILAVLAKLLKAKHEGEKEVESLRAKKIVIKSKNLIIGGMDGEVLSDKEYKIEVVAKAVTIYNDQKFVEEVLEYERRNKSKVKTIK